MGQAALDLLDNPDEELLLAPEVMIERSSGEPAAFDDILERDVPEAPLRE